MPRRIEGIDSFFASARLHKKKDIRAEIEDHAQGIYSVTLFVAADSPDNLDKQVSIGWVNLDTNTMQALDVTRDPDHPDVLKVDADKYKNFVSACLLTCPRKIRTGQN